MTDQPTNDPTAPDPEHICRFCNAWGVKPGQTCLACGQLNPPENPTPTPEKNAFGRALDALHEVLTDEDRAAMDKELERREKHYPTPVTGDFVKGQTAPAHEALDPQGPTLRNVNITICQPCLDGIGSECHTPGCALYLHHVDLPIAPELYTILPDSPLSQQQPEALDPAAETLYKKAHRYIHELSCREREWIMSIPANPREDVDIVLSDALRAEHQRAEAAEARVREVEHQLEMLSDGMRRAGWGQGEIDCLATLEEKFEGIEPALKNAEADNAKLRAAIEYELEHTPQAVRVCESGGPEDITASLSVTCLKLRERVAELESKVS